MTIDINKITDTIANQCNPLMSQGNHALQKCKNRLAQDVFELSDSKLLSAIKDHIAKLKNSCKGKLLLSYGHYLEGDIPYQKGNFYRAMGKGGYDDFLSTGLLRAKPDGKYGSVYFDIDAASKKYAQGLAGEYIAETNSCKIKNLNGFYGADFIDSADDKIRIWKRKPGTKKYEIVFDTMDDVISRHPNFRV